MATSGSTNVTVTAYDTLQFSWSQSSQSVANNTTTISWSLKLIATAYGAIYSSASKSWSVTVNGINYNGTNSVAIGNNTTKTLASGTTTIAHNSDGTKTFAFSFSQAFDITFSGSWVGTKSGSGSGVLNSIARATTPTVSPTSVDMGSSVTISMPRASSSFTHDIAYSLNGGTYYVIANGQGTSYTWTVPDLATSIPNATSGTVTIRCTTKNGSTSVGVKTCTLTIKVPSSVVPTISNVTNAETVSGIAAKFSAYIQTKSKVAVTFNSAGAKGSTMTSWSATFDGKSYNGTFTNGQGTFTSSAISGSGNLPLKITVTDSRGRTATATQNITVLTYSNPKISAFYVQRINTSGTLTEDGNRIKIIYQYSISSCNNLNDHTYSVHYKQSDASSFTQFDSGNTTGYLGNVSHSYTSSPAISPDYTWIIELRITDFFSTTTYSVEIPTGFTLMDFRSTGKGMAIGKVSEKDELEIALNVDITGELIQEEMQTPTLLNSWVNYGSYQTAGYWKDKCGTVHLRGMIKGGLTAAETIIFNLPSGYRPSASEKFFAVSLNNICVIDIYTSGNVAIKTGANSGWLSLSGISFRAGA